MWQPTVLGVIHNKEEGEAILLTFQLAPSMSCPFGRLTLCFYLQPQTGSHSVSQAPPSDLLGADHGPHKDHGGGDLGILPGSRSGTRKPLSTPQLVTSASDITRPCRWRA